MSKSTYNKEDLDTFALAYGVRIPPQFDSSLITGEESSESLRAKLHNLKKTQSILEKKLSMHNELDNSPDREIQEILNRSTVNNTKLFQKLDYFNNIYEKVIQFNCLLNQFKKIAFPSNEQMNEFLKRDNWCSNADAISVNINSILTLYQEIEKDSHKYNRIIYALTKDNIPFKYNRLKSPKILLVEMKHIYNFINVEFNKILDDYQSIEMIENILVYLHEETIKNY